jgi:hypothetical protein
VPVLSAVARVKAIVVEIAKFDIPLERNVRASLVKKSKVVNTVVLYLIGVNHAS